MRVEVLTDTLKVGDEVIIEYTPLPRRIIIQRIEKHKHRLELWATPDPPPDGVPHTVRIGGIDVTYSDSHTDRYWVPLGKLIHKIKKKKK